MYVWCVVCVRVSLLRLVDAVGDGRGGDNCREPHKVRWTVFGGRLEMNTKNKKINGARLD